MNLNVYLPDELGERAKEAQINLSRLLRHAVGEELSRRDALNHTLEEQAVYELRVEDRDNRVYVGRITGVQLATSGDLEIYLTRDRRVIAYNRFKLKHWVVDDPEAELRELIEPGAYVEVMALLGVPVSVDL